MPDAAALIASLPANGYELTVEEELGEPLHVRVVETETSTAHRGSADGDAGLAHVLCGSARTRRSRTSWACPVHCRLREQVVARGDLRRVAASSLDLAKEGMQISRFKVSAR